MNGATHHSLPMGITHYHKVPLKGGLPEISPKKGSMNHTRQAKGPLMMLQLNETSKSLVA
jgi:hypothetical protein